MKSLINFKFLRNRLSGNINELFGMNWLIQNYTIQNCLHESQH